MTLRAANLLTALLLLVPGALFAQPTEEEKKKKDEDGLQAWANDLNRPMARALAYERRDVVKELLETPGSLGAADAVELSRDVGIPLADAKAIVEAARAERLGGARLQDLVKIKVPEGVKLSDTALNTGKVADFVAAGMTEAQAQEVVRFRLSAKRAHLHFREIQAIAEVRAKGVAAASEAVGAGKSLATRIDAIASGLGLKAEAANSASEEMARLKAEVAALRAKTTDALAEFRRVDGTLDWGRMGKSELLKGASGVGHFAMALFLKELAVTLRTGDRARLEQFVDGLLSTDFFINYGLFAAGARVADVAYGRYVRRLARKRFVNGVLRSNLVLAAGLAVPMAVRGEFQLDTYLVDVAALGLSATAVKAAVEGTKGVWRLVRGGKSAVNLGKLATPLGWIYSVGETAVVLYVGDALAARFDAYLTERNLRDKIKQAEGELNAALARLERGESVLPSDLDKALRDLESGYDDLRRLRLMPLDERVRAFRRELTSASEKMLEGETAVTALEERLKDHPSLANRLAERYGSTDAYLERIRAARASDGEERVKKASEEFEERFNPALEKAYRGESEGAAPAPGSRLASYDDETSHLLAALDKTTDPEARRYIVLAIERVRLGRAIDSSVLSISQPNTAPASAPAPGPAASNPEDAWLEGTREGMRDRVPGATPGN
ncbi:MAG: hypothetical protein AB7N76_25575 [Planctomycetota bacterium]